MHVTQGSSYLYRAIALSAIPRVCTTWCVFNAILLRSVAHVALISSADDVHNDRLVVAATEREI